MSVSTNPFWMQTWPVTKGSRVSLMSCSLRLVTAICSFPSFHPAISLMPSRSPCLSLHSSRASRMIKISSNSWTICCRVVRSSLLLGCRSPFIQEEKSDSSALGVLVHCIESWLNKRTHHFLILLLLNIVEIEVEIHNSQGRDEITMMDNIIDDRRGQNSFTASRDSMQPKEQIWICLPINKLIAFNKPCAGCRLALLACVIIIKRRIWR
jgi:hypothetical protein